MLAAMAFDAQPVVRGQAMAVNYGFDRVRMLGPVRSGGRIRGRFILSAITDRGLKEFMTKIEATLEIEGSGRKFIEAGEQAAIDAIPGIKDRVMSSADAAEGIQSFIERRSAVFQGR